MIPKYLLRNKALVACATSIALVAMVFSVAIVLIGLYLQNAKGLSSYKTGVVFFTMTFSMGLLSPFIGILVDRFGVRKPIIWSLVLAIMGTFVMASLDTETELPLIIISLFLVGVGLGGYFKQVILR
jgi:MFS family permease